MIELEVLEDIRSYRSKIIGPFTKEQFIAFLLCGFIDFIMYECLIRPLGLPSDYIIYFCVIPDVIIYGYVAGYVMGMIPMRRFIRIMINYNILAPKNRKAKNPSAWKNVTTFSHSQTGIKKEKIPVKELKKHPEYIAYK